MVEVVVGRQNQIGLRQFAVIPELADRIDMDHLAAELEHQRSVADESDLQVPRRGRQDVRLEPSSGPGRNRRQ